MNVYLVIPDDYGYDEYDSCTVVAKDREEAIKMANEDCRPAGFEPRFKSHQYPLTAIEIDLSTKGIISSSFNAG